MLDYGKLPPQAKEMEEAVLGAIMIESDCISLVEMIIRSEKFFYVDAHERIYRAIMMLHKANEPIDFLTVTEQLKRNLDLDASGGTFYVATLTNKVASSAHVEHHSRIIAEKYMQRKLIETSSDVIKDAYEDGTDVFDLIAKATSKLDTLVGEVGKFGIDSFADQVENFVVETKRAANDKTYTIGLKTHIGEVDRVSGGFKPGDLIIVAARPSMGKTCLVLDIARRQAANGSGVGIFSLEMSTIQLIQRMASAESLLPFDKILNGGMTREEWLVFDAAVKRLKEMPLHIEDRIVGINEMKSIARNWKKKFDIKELIVDYLQLIPGDDGRRNQNREQEMSGISRQLKLLAKELQIPIIALSQLSRKCEERKDQHPMLSDLRESGAIEQDADTVIMLYRKSYYEPDNKDMTTDIDFCKHRNGKTGIVYQSFDGAHQRFIGLGAYKDEMAEMEIDF